MNCFGTLLLINGCCTAFWFLQKSDSYCSTNFQIYIAKNEIVSIKFTAFAYFFQCYFNNCLPNWPLFPITHNGILANKQNVNTYVQTVAASVVVRLATDAHFSNDIQVTGCRREMADLFLKISNYIFELSSLPKYNTITVYSKFSEYITTVLSFVAGRSWKIVKAFWL